MYNNYNNYNNFYPYNNYIRNIPNNFSGSFRNTPNYMYSNSVRNPLGSSGGFLSRLFSGLGGSSVASGTATATNGITFTEILNGASKTLGVINQAIPVFYQIKPIWNNAKTMLRIAKAMNSNDEKESTTNSINLKSSQNTTTNKNNNETISSSKIINEEGPTFFN